MILDIQSVKSQIGGESDEENEADLGENPMKKVQFAETSGSVGFANTGGMQQPVAKAPKGSGSKVLANLIQTSLDEANVPLEKEPKKKGAAKSKEKVSKKGSKTELAENLDNPDVVILDGSPDSPKQKRKPAKKKNNGKEKEKEKEKEAVSEIKESPTKTSAIKVGDLNEVSKPQTIIIDQPQTMPQHFTGQYGQPQLIMQQQGGFTNPEDELKNKLGLLMQGNMINSMFSLNPEDLTRILQGSVPQLNANGLYGQSRPFM